MGVAGKYAIVGVLVAAFVFTSVHIKRSELEGNTIFGTRRGGVGRPDKSPMSGRKAPEFSLTSLQGKQVSLADFNGQVVLLDFWASWCPPCRASMPLLGGLDAKYRDKGLKVISINERDTPALAEGVVKEMKYKALVLLDEDGSVADRYQIEYLPTLILIDQKGKVVWLKAGFAPYEAEPLERRICDLLRVKYTHGFGGGPSERN